MKALEAYLNEYDFFSFKSLLERQKLKFHNDYMKAKAIYHENPIYDPDFHKKSSTTDKDETSKSEQKKSNDELEKQQDTKCDQLMELFYKIYEETAGLQKQKHELEETLETHLN